MLSVQASLRAFTLILTRGVTSTKICILYKLNKIDSGYFKLNIQLKKINPTLNTLPKLCRMIASGCWLSFYFCFGIGLLAGFKLTLKILVHISYAGRKLDFVLMVLANVTDFEPLASMLCCLIWSTKCKYLMLICIVWALNFWVLVVLRATSSVSCISHVRYSILFNSRLLIFVFLWSRILPLNEGVFFPFVC